MPPIGSWTPERVETLKTLWAKGLSAAQIAKELGEPLLSRNSVIGKANRLKLPARTPNRFVSSEHRRKAMNATRSLVKNPGRPRKDGSPPRRRAAKQVNLPALPINRPNIMADTKFLKSAAWEPLASTTPKRLADLGDIGRADRLGECRWPVGENPALFCASPCRSVYCPTHAAMAKRKIAA